VLRRERVRDGVVDANDVGIGMVSVGPPVQRPHSRELVPRDEFGKLPLDYVSPKLDLSNILSLIIMFKSYNLDLSLNIIYYYFIAHVYCKHYCFKHEKI